MYVDKFHKSVLVVTLEGGLTYNKVSNKICLFDVKCTKALEDELIRLGVEPIEYRTGNSYTRAASAEAFVRRFRRW